MRWPPLAEPGEPTRFFVRVHDVALPGVRSYSGWTVLQILPDPNQPGTNLVEVEDPNAPPSAAGKICDPTFSRSGTGQEPDAVWISDYGIPA